MVATGKSVPVIYGYGILNRQRALTPEGTHTERTLGAGHRDGQKVPA